MRRSKLCLLTAALLLGSFGTSCAQNKAVEHWGIEVVREYPHSTESYTQGFFFHGDRLYESTGLNGKSRLQIVDLESGKALVSRKFSQKYFAEGSAVLDGKLFVLTWTNKVVFIYDPETLEYRSTWSYPREGWGLTTDGKSLVASDGSANLYFLSSALKQERVLKVTINGRPLRLLNELEWIDGRIWANVYTTDSIVVINPRSGVVEAVIDCSGLLPDSLRTADTDVLNGIAVSPDGRIFLTGKNWPKIYEVVLKK